MAGNGPVRFNHRMSTSGDILPFTATQTTLPNGLRVIIVPTGFPHLVSLQIPVQTGSRNEVEPGKSGFAHFFEHMMFRGTKRFPAHAYQEVVTRSGARQNAYTTDDYTNYHMTFAREDLDQILAIEADRFMNLDYSEADFRTEARAILGEYNKSASDPLNKLIEVQRDHAFQVHPYKHTTMGFIADIEQMPEQFEYSRLFFDRWYRPEYSTVILAGDVDAESCIPLVAKHFGAWRPGSAPPTTIPAEPAPTGAVVAHVPWPVETLPWVTVGFHAPAFSTTTSDFAALDMLFDLTFGPTSDLYQDLVERRQVVDQLFPHVPGNADPELATVFARVKDPADAALVREALFEALRGARDTAITAQRLAEAKSHARYSFARTLDNSESIAATLARFVRYERDYGTLNALYRRYDALTPADLQAAARGYLRDDALVATTLSQASLGASFAAPPTLARHRATATLAAPIVRQDTPSALVRFKLAFAVGSAHDPAGKEGLAALAAEMVTDGGSEALRIDEVKRALFPIAGAFSARVDKEVTTFTGVIHKDNLRAFLPIVLPQLTKPGLRDDDFSRLREAQRNELVQDLRSNNEEELGKERLQTLALGPGPYGHPVLGTETGIAGITAPDVREWLATQYTQGNLTLGGAGDLGDDGWALITAALSELPLGTPTAPPAVSVSMPTGITVEIIEKETRSTAISFGHPITVTRSHDDFAALWLARAWLGEHRASNGRLFQRLREVRGMNYGDYAYIEAFPRGMYQFFPDTGIPRRQQLFEVWIRPVVPEQAVFAFKLALHEVRQLIDQGLSPEAFEATRAYLAKNLYVMTKTQDQQLGYALDSRWHGIGDFVDTMQARLAALTVEAVNAAIRRHLSGDNLVAVFIAKDAQALKAALLSEAPTTIEYESPKDAAIGAEDAVAGAISLGLAPERITITPLAEVFRA